MKDGHWEETDIGSPQGGVISPLLANIYLNRFDQARKNKGIQNTENRKLFKESIGLIVKQI
ncbi:hypothetical protein L7E55_02345 [Pelotomaculum isophthalicicum JI]|uniref:Reverse transcriptase domain-containing protein n=1 Tax=Pelotomaculum isophthalicicum JI TaxID=947010 RepID=A0A9X4GXV7_9FIRM|nr:hypothetical protein [Pelotomaculum isophthalicicum]MDF9407205.1 hypothetical protein [Pelotomaculum isophthalicicum JI]